MTPLETVAPIQNVPVELNVELDRRMLKLRDILELQAGSILELPRSAGENIDIYIGNRLIGYGEIVVIESSMGVRITDFRMEK